MKKLVMLVAALMAVAFVGLNYESTAYANDRAIPSIGVSGGTDSISVVWTAPTEAPYDYRIGLGPRRRIHRIRGIEYVHGRQRLSWLECHVVHDIWPRPGHL